MLSDTMVLIELGNEANDESVVPEVKGNVKKLSKKIDNLEVPIHNILEHDYLDDLKSLSKIP